MNESDLIYTKSRAVSLATCPALDEVARCQLMALASAWRGRTVTAAEDFFEIMTEGSGARKEDISVSMSRVALKDQAERGLFDYWDDPYTGTGMYFYAGTTEATSVYELQYTREGKPFLPDTIAEALERCMLRALDEAVAAGAVDGLLEDPEFLVHIPPAVLMMHVDLLYRPGAERARRLWQVYRSSLHKHRHLGRDERRHVLYADAMRHGFHDLATGFAAGWVVERGADVRWVCEVFTGHQLAPGLLGTFAGHKDWVQAVTLAWLDADLVVISGDKQGWVRLWNLTTGEEWQAPRRLFQTPVTALEATVVDGAVVLVAATTWTVDFYLLPSWNKVSQLVTDFLEDDHIIDVKIALWDTEVATLVVASRHQAARKVTAWELGTGRPIPGAGLLFEGRLSCMALTTHAGRPAIVLADRKGALYVRGFGQGDEAREVRIGAHQGMVSTVTTMQADGRHLVISGGDDGTVRCWDPTTAAAHGQPLRETGARICALTTAVVDSRAVVIAADEDERLQVWDAATGDCLAHTAGVSGPVCAMHVVEVEGRTILVTGDGDLKVQLWDLADMCATAPSTATPHEWIISIAVREGGEGPGLPLRVVTGGGDGTVQRWRLGENTAVAEVWGSHSKSEVWGLVATTVKGTSVVVSGAADGTLTRWDPPADGNRTPIGTPLIAAQPVGAIEDLTLVHVHGVDLVVTSHVDGHLRRWNLASGRPVGTPRKEPAWNRGIDSVELGGTSAVISSSDVGSLYRWDAATGQPLGSPVTGHADRVRALATAYVDGRPVAVTGDDAGTVRIWDLTTRQPGASLTYGGLRHGGWVLAAATGELDGRPIAATGDYAGTIHLWDLTSQRHLATLHLPDAVSCLTFTPTGSLVIGAGRELAHYTPLPPAQGASKAR